MNKISVIKLRELRELQESNNFIDELIEFIFQPDVKECCDKTSQKKSCVKVSQDGVQQILARMSEVLDFFEDGDKEEEMEEIEEVGDQEEKDNGRDLGKDCCNHARRNAGIVSESSAEGVVTEHCCSEHGLNKPQAITEEMNLQEEWSKIALTRINTTGQLFDFIDSLFNNYIHDYGTVVHAIVAASLATASCLTRREGLTGFQGGCIASNFLKRFQYPNNKMGIGIFDYDKLLYPQYDYYFEKKITKEMWETLQQKAREELSKNAHLRCEVKEHMLNIVAGKVPFGFKVQEDA